MVCDGSLYKQEIIRICEHQYTSHKIKSKMIFSTNWLICTCVGFAVLALCRWECERITFLMQVLAFAAFGAIPLQVILNHDGLRAFTKRQLTFELT